VSGKIFPTAQDVENAFYEALEAGDLEAMMAAWSEDEEILCVHPTGPRLAGQDQVRASWAQIFAGGARTRVHISHQVTLSGMMIEVHSVQENFAPEGEARGSAGAQQGRDMRPAPIVATNVYLRTAAGWRMIVHHASPAPGETEQAPSESSHKILH